MTKTILTIGASKQFLKWLNRAIKERLDDYEIIDFSEGIDEDIQETINNCICAIHLQNYENSIEREMSGSIANYVGGLFRASRLAPILIHVSLRGEREDITAPRINRRIKETFNETFYDVSLDTDSKYYSYILYDYYDDEDDVNSDLDYEAFGEELASLICGEVERPSLVNNEFVIHDRDDLDD